MGEQVASSAAVVGAKHAHFKEYPKCVLLRKFYSLICTYIANSPHAMNTLTNQPSAGDFKE